MPPERFVIPYKLNYAFHVTTYNEIALHWLQKYNLYVLFPQVFNSISLECDHPSKVKCEPFNGFSRPARRVPAANLEFGYDHGPKTHCGPGDSGQYPHPDCAKFIECDNGRTFVKDCGPGISMFIISNVQ